MGPLDSLFHLLNFMAPALCMALLIACFSHIFMKKQAAVPMFVKQVAINFGVGLLLLMVGLWFFGNDGKVATYAALVLGCATSQMLMLRR
jgi:hypothetical protein